MKADLNTYAYVQSTPLLLTDPEGLTAAAAAISMLGGGGGAAAAGGTAGGIGLGTIAVGLAGVGAAGLAGWGIGSAIYPGIEPGLSKGIDWVCNSMGKSRIERCNDAVRRCMANRKDPAWLNRCAKSLGQCLNTDLPVIFPNGDVVK